MRRSLAPLLALAALACARDLELPDSSPPRVDSLQLVGLEADTPPVPLPVLGGELLAIRGGGFPADAAQLEVRIGSEDAEVLETTPDRIVLRMPALAARGAADLQVRTPVGFRTETGALRYDGPGQPEGFDTSDLKTAVPLGFVAPVQPPGSTGFSDLAIAIGASDSALLVVPEVGLAATTIPLGLVPSSAAARIRTEANGDLGVEVLAVARGGEVALGKAVLRDGLLANRVAARPLSHGLVNPTACSSPQVTFTNLGTAVAAWTAALTGQQRIAAIDDGQLALGEYAPVGTPHPVAAPIVGWAPWKAFSVIFAAGGEIYLYDASTPALPPAPLTVAVGGVGPPQPVSSLLTAACPGAGLTFTTLAAASSPYPAPAGTDLLALSFRAGGVDWVALVDLTPGPTAGRVRQGLAGTIVTSLALVPEPPYQPTSWAVLGAGITNLYRFRPLAAADACRDLVPDAALPLSSAAGVLPTFGGMLTTSSGTRLLATTPDGDLVTVLPPSLTSAGPVFRVASYGGLSMQVASLGGEALPVAVAEHAFSLDDLSALDTGSALLVVSLAGDGGTVALGGSGYGRGAVWLDPPAGGALAYTGDLPSPAAGAVSTRGGAAAVTGFTAGICPGEDVRITGSRPVAGGPDLVAQGPARAGALGPEGIARWGPAAAPIYAAKNQSLAIYASDPANLACLAGATPSWDPTGCPPDATLPLGVEPLDVTLSAGDRAVAVRSFEPDPSACTLAPGFAAGCAAGDLLCLRASCPPARSLAVVRPGVAPVTLPLPARPAAVTADRGGGFLVTLPCEVSSTSGGDDCFPSSALCEGFLTGPGGADGALLLVAEDGAAAACLAVLPALAGAVAVTPNGAEAWVTAPAFGAQILSRLSLPRRTSDGAIDTARPAARLSVEALGAAARPLGAFPAGGVAFTPDGATGIVTVPGEYRIQLHR